MCMATVLSEVSHSSQIPILLDPTILQSLSLIMLDLRIRLREYEYGIIYTSKCSKTCLKIKVIISRAEICSLC